MNDVELFEPFTLGHGPKLRNRIVMSPMTTWSAQDDGNVSEQELDYYRARVKDVGLVITGCTHVQPNGAGFSGEFAAFDDQYLPSLARLASAAKSGGAPAILQIFHAGAKTTPDLSSDIVAASVVPSDPGPFGPSVTPRALSNSEIVDVVAAFGEATRRAIVAGFDGVEIHGAHGFLPQNFFSPRFNMRDDAWGGTLEKRLRFPLAVVAEVRSVVAEHAQRPFAIGYRISPEEANEDGLRIADTLVLIDHLIEMGIDYLHISLPDALATKPFGAPEGAPIVKVVTDHVAQRLPVIAAGSIRTPAQAKAAIAAGLSLVAIGQGLVMNPNWVALARDGHVDAIKEDIARSERQALHVPDKLWAIIEAAQGWFRIRPE
jgi:2,4-dienoyl-CoA reductase-like NADH-dependent reductase (Old Yellow Enzyme family)